MSKPKPSSINRRLVKLADQERIDQGLPPFTRKERDAKLAYLKQIDEEHTEALLQIERDQFESSDGVACAY